MDFSFTEDQEAVRGLARQIFEGQVTPDRLREVGSDAERFDRRTWQELAKANLLGLSLPEDVGGSGLGFLETCLVLEEVGRAVPFVPVLASVVLGALPIAEFGSAELRKAVLPAAAVGEVVLTAALVEEGTSPERPSTAATRDGEGWRLEGTKVSVPFGTVADRFVVPAMAPEGLTVFVVDAAAGGVSRIALETTSGLPEALIELDGARAGDADVLGEVGGGAVVLDWIVQRAIAGMCVTAIGVCAEALRLTAEYTKSRVQFERPIATFQAVAQRAADAYIDTEGIRLTAWQAAWRLSAGLPAAEEVAIAKFWAAEGGQRVVHAAQHLHGGMGVDRDYPLHRYFLWAKELELTLGGSTAQLLKLGKLLATTPVEV